MLELVLVLAIFAVLAAIAAPKYAASACRYRADAAARRIVADMSLARSKAYQSSRSMTVTFDLAANQAKIPGLPGLKSPTSDFATIFSDEPYRARLISADFSGNPAVVFDIFGMPDSAGQIVIEVGDARRTIVLDGLTGKAAVQ